MGHSGQLNERQGGHSPRAVMLPCVQISIPTLAAVPSTLGEVLVASLDTRSPSSCEATAAALAAVNGRRGAQCGHTERWLALWPPLGCC